MRRVVSARRATDTTPFMSDGRTTRDGSDRRFDCGKAIAAFGGAGVGDWVAGPVESDSR